MVVSHHGLLGGDYKGSKGIAAVTPVLLFCYDMTISGTFSAVKKALRVCIKQTNSNSLPVLYIHVHI